MLRCLALFLMVGCALYAGFMAITAFANGTSAVHEIEALIAVLIVAVVASALYVGASLERR
jgi:polyferredoxin